MLTYYGAEAADTEIKRGDKLRNLLNNTDHPVAVSRLDLVLETPVWSLQTNPASKLITDIVSLFNFSIKRKTDEVWAILKENHLLISKTVEKSPYLQQIPESVLAELNAIGKTDFCTPIAKRSLLLPFE